MRLLQVIASMDPAGGGLCQGLRNLTPALEKLGVPSEVVCLDDPASAFLGRDPFPIHALGRGRGAWCHHRALMPWLVENMPRFEAVIVNGLWLYPSHAVRQAARTLSKPRVYVMPHGMLDPYFQRDTSRRLKAIRNWLYWKLIESRVVADADGLLFTCEQELLLARDTFQPYRPKRELNAGFGIAEPPASTSAARTAFLEKCPALGDRAYLLFLSRIHEKKGLDLLIRAYAALGPAPLLVIAGPLDSDYARAMQKLAADLCPPGSVHWPGMLSGEAKWGAFHGCAAFILPSHQENFGIAVAEALACGKPVLISNQVNIWREIGPSGAGLVADDSEPGIREMLQRWLALSPEAVSAMRNAARACHEKHFTIDGAAARLASLLR